jgi:hypothetical protein
MIKAMILSFDDNKRRLSAMVFGWLAGTAVGVIASASSASVNTAGGLSLAIAVLVFIAMLRPVKPARAVSSSRVPSKRDFLQFAYGGAAAALLLIVDRLLLTPESVHAAAEEQFEKAFSANPGNRFSTAKLLAVQARVKKLLAETSHQGTIRKTLVSDYAKLEAASVYPASARVPPAENGTIRCNLERPGPCLAEVTNYAFLDITFTTNAPGTQLLTLPHIVFFRPIFKNCTIQEFSVELSTVVWADVTFDRCTLLYSGGPLLLVGVRAMNSTIEIGKAVSGELAAAIRRSFASAGSITFTSQYPT